MSADKKQKTPNPSSPVIRDAATVILVRESDRTPFEIFLMRRHGSQSFMGGAFVFPGGRLDEDDCDPELAEYTRNFSLSEANQRLQEPELPEKTARGLYFAAIRETFEESGVLAAFDSSGHLMDFSEGERAGRFAAYRLKLHQKTLSLKELAQKENIRYALDLLTPYSHWITPDIEKKRYDTRFFLMRQPKGQFPVHDTIELTQSLWITPASALEQQRKGQILLMPPTLKTMEELNKFQTVNQLFTAAAAGAIDTILPQGFAFDGGFGVKLPHDPEYTIAAYKQRPRPDETSRIIMKDGRWRAQQMNVPD